MYVLVVKGARNATLAFHRSETRAEIDELIQVYQALGYELKALIVDDSRVERAA